MFRHLTPADYRTQPWANGRGQTVELARQDGPEGMLWRLSVATVAENGPFSRFPGIRRNLTVIDGPGFRIRGDGIDLDAAPLSPVAFPGDATVSAEGVTGPSRDFNVMTSAALPPPVVWLASGDIPGNGLTAIYALEPARVGAAVVAPGGLILTDSATCVTEGRVLAVRIGPLRAPG